MVSSLTQVNHGSGESRRRSGAGKYFQLSPTVRTRNRCPTVWGLLQLPALFLPPHGLCCPTPRPQRERGVWGWGGCCQGTQALALLCHWPDGWLWAFPLGRTKDHWAADFSDPAGLQEGTLRACGEGVNTTGLGAHCHLLTPHLPGLLGNSRASGTWLQAPFHLSLHDLRPNLADPHTAPQGGWSWTQAAAQQGFPQSTRGRSHAWARAGLVRAGLRAAVGTEI